MNIKMILLKDCPMGKAGDAITVHAKHQADYFVENEVAVMEADHKPVDKKQKEKDK